MLVNRNFMWVIHIYSSIYSFIFFFFFPCISVMLYANLVGGTEPNLMQLNAIQHHPLICIYRTIVLDK